MEIVRRFVEGLVSTPDDGHWQQVVSDLDTDVAIDDLDISLDTERYRGHDGFRKWISDWSESFPRWRIEGVEVRPVGVDRLVVLFEMFVEGRESGIELSRHDAMVFTLREAKITGIVYYNDQQQALEAVGLTEWAMSQESTTPDLVERWRQAAEAAYRGDLDATMGIFAPDAVWELEPLGISYRGAPAIRSFLEDWLGSYENYEDDQEEALDLGNGVVFVVSRLDARPVGSPSRVQERWSFTVLWEAGMVMRVTGRNDINAARAAAERLAESRG